MFPYVKREPPGKVGEARFLWVGANSTRKGWELVLRAWRRFRTLWDFQTPPDIQAAVRPIMYIKTTFPPPEPGHEDLTGFEVAPGDDVILDSRRLPLDELVGIYHWAHCFVFPSMGEGYGLCVHPETRIETPLGAKAIKDARPGDRVMTHTGEFKRVHAVTSRRVKTLCEIKIARYGTLRVSPEHPFLASPKRSRETKRYTLSWTPAAELTRGSLVAIAKAKLDRGLPRTIDLGSVPGVVVTEDRVGFKMGFSPSNKALSLRQLCDLLGETKKVIETAVKHVRRGTVPRKDAAYFRTWHVHRQLIDMGYVPPQPKTYPRFVRVDDDFQEFVGWYIAEGSSQRNALIELSLGEGDREFLPKLRRAMRREEEEPMVLHDLGHHKIRVLTCHGPLASWLEDACGKGARP